MKRLILLLLFAIVFQFSYSQISGYMGKKFSILYSPTLSLPGYSIAGQNLALLPKDMSYINLSHGVSVEYLTRSFISLGLQYRLSSNNYNNDQNYSDYLNFSERYLFTSHSFNFYGKFHFNKRLAPLSAFTKIGFGLQEKKLKDYIFSHDNSVNKGSYSQLDFKYNISFGKNWIIADYLLLGFELEHALPVNSFRQDYSRQGPKEIVTRARLNQINFITEIAKISLNIGFIAF